jgi:hypothetical protein
MELSDALSFLFPVPRQELPINSQRPADIARIIFHIDGAGGGTDHSRPAPENLSQWRSFVQNRLQVPTATGPA